MQKRFNTLFLIICLLNLNAFGQKKLDRLISNSNFEWTIDSVGNKIFIYYEKNSYAEKHKEKLKEKIRYHIKSTIDFTGIERYDKPIHYFILENRQRMKHLVGYETNGNAVPKNNFITAIFSEKSKSVYSNHELFHLIAMNVWGYPEIWINEGMAVYADNSWYGHNLHELSKYLIDNNKYIDLQNLTRKFKDHDDLNSYPLIGSFTKFIDENYGRETIKKIWQRGKKRIKRQTGKSLEELEQEWLKMLKSITYKAIEYQK